MAATDCRQAPCASTGSLILPVVGPFMLASERFATPGQQGLAIALGAAQLAGAGLLIAGVVLENKVLIRKAPVALAPTLSPGGAGLTIAGAM